MPPLTKNQHAWVFTPTQWASAADKQKFAHHYISFVQARCPFQKFHEWFYNRLMHMFMHIAHYNRYGFYETWCGSPEKRFNLLRYHLAYAPVGDPAWTWSDVERELQIWLAESGIVHGYEFEAQTEQRHALTAAAGIALTELPDEVVLRLVQERLTASPALLERSSAATQSESRSATTQSLPHPHPALSEKHERVQAHVRAEQQVLFEL